MIIECQKINVLDNTPNFSIILQYFNWVEINDGSYGAYSTGS